MSVDFQISMYKSDLFPVLNRAFPMVPSKDLLPLLKNFYFEATVNPHKLVVSVTDLEVGMVGQTTAVTVSEAGSVTLPAARTLAILRECDDDIILLSVSNSTATIECNSAKWNLKLADLGEFPHLVTDPEDVWREVSRVNLLEGLEEVRYAASRDTMQAALMMVDIRKGAVRAADGTRFQQVDIGIAPEIELQIPIHAVDTLVKTLKFYKELDTISVGSTSATLLFKLGTDVMRIQKASATFPPMDEQLLKPALLNEFELKVGRDALIHAVRRVQVTADVDTNAVILHLDVDAVAVTSKDRYGSWSEENIKASWTGKADRRAAFNFHHLLEMLRCADDEVSLWLGPDKKTRPSALLLKGEGKTAAVLSQVRHDWP